MRNWLKDGYSRVMLSSVLAVTLICAFVVINGYQTQIRIYEEQELAKLSGIASTLSLQLSAEEHAVLAKKYPGKDAISSTLQDDQYHDMHDILQMAKARNGLTEAIYTMVYDSVRNKFCFAITSNEESYWMHAYHGFPDDLLRQYDTGGTLAPYEDENGHWLSAFAPLKTDDGTTVALLQVDQKFDQFIMMARAAAWKNIIFSFLGVASLSTIMLLLIRSLLQHQRKLQLERSTIDQQRRELTANISHDLRTPLASIHGYVETLLLKKESLGEERQTRYLNTALQNTKKLKTLVDQLFELSRLESKQKKLNIESFNIVELLYDITTSLKLVAKEQGMKLKVVGDSDDIPLVKGDLAEIDRVLQNIIGNSLQHGSEGQTISLKPTLSDGRVLVSIEDDGPGIAPEMLAHVFDRFSTMKENGQGSGLGLAIVKRILDLHGSEYGLDSEEGKGTTFWFDLAIVSN